MSERKKITLTDARGVLARAVLTQGPDFVYSPNAGAMCYYDPVNVNEAFSPEDPRLKTPCLIGVALNLAGEERHHHFHGQVYREENPDYQWGTLFGAFPDMMTEKAGKYFRAAQAQQDEGKTWGAAYATAEASLVPEPEMVG